VSKRRQNATKKALPAMQSSSYRVDEEEEEEEGVTQA
jgi:hypothetical protein